MQQSDMSERGVYWARYTKGGKLMLYAVDSKADEVRRLILQHTTPAHIAHAIESLWSYLDIVDPGHAKPQLRIVNARILPSTDRRAELEAFDPYNPAPVPYRRPRLL